MKYLLTLFLILLVGCRSVPQDHTPAPINHNKMTLELQSCDKQEVGLIGCFYNQAQEGLLTVPLWSSGEYQIKSERCGFFANYRYEGTQKVEWSYQELLASKPTSEKTCLYNIKVFIDGFDNGFEGFFLLNEGDNKPLEFEFKNKNYLGYAGIQLKEGTTILNTIAIKADKPGLIFWEGCEKKGEIKYKSNPEIPFDKIIETLIPKSSCVLTIGLIPNDIHLPVELGKIHINIFEKTVADFPMPVLEYENEKLIVRADRLTAVIAIGEKYSVKKGNGNKKLTAHVPQDEEVDVRLATSNGRYMLLRVKNGEVLWVK